MELTTLAARKGYQILDLAKRYSDEIITEMEEHHLSGESTMSSYERVALQYQQAARAFVLAAQHFHKIQEYKMHGILLDKAEKCFQQSEEIRNKGVDVSNFADEKSFNLAD